MTEVAVVGAGLVGTTVAHDLARAGVAVTVFERDDVGAGATRQAAGIVHDAFASERERSLARRSIERFVTAGADGLDIGHTPYVWFARGEGESATAVRRDAARIEAAGGAVELVDRDWLRTRYPQLNVESVNAAAVAHDALVADAEAYARFMADEARSLGATLRTGIATIVGPGPTVHGESRRSFDAVVVAAGAWTPSVLASAVSNPAVAAFPAMALRADGPAIPSVYDANTGVYFRPHRRGIVAGQEWATSTVDPAQWRPAVPRDSVAAVREALDSLLINYEGRIRRAWDGLCTATPDGLPLIGPVGEDIYVATGWHGRGLMLGPAAGERLAAIVLGERQPIDFDPGRFTGEESIEVRAGITTDDPT